MLLYAMRVEATTLDSIHCSIMIPWLSQGDSHECYSNRLAGLHPMPAHLQTTAAAH